MDIDLKKLCEPFLPSEIEWRVGAVNKEKMKGIALPYITNRAVQNRLDKVCGIENWWNEFKTWGENSQLCGITILFNDRPVTKWDGADNTATEATKGGLSNAMKRAAAQWGIGRYLYDLPTYWVDVEQAGKTYKLVKIPTLPSTALPKDFKGKQQFADSSDVLNENDKTLDDIIDSPDRILDKDKADMFLSILQDYQNRGRVNIPKLLAFYKVSSVYELTCKQYANICLRLAEQNEKIEKAKSKSKEK